MQKKLIYIVFLIFVFTSCRNKKIRVTLPLTESELVMNAVFTNGKPFEVYVNSTVGALDTSLFSDTSNLVLLYNENGNIMDVLQYSTSKGSYKSNPLIFPENGKKYTIALRDKITLQNVVTAMTISPDSLLANKYAIYDSAAIVNGSLYDEIEFTLNDKTGKNYYSLIIYNVSASSGNLPTPYITDDDVLNSLTTQTNLTEKIFTDEKFDGKSHTFKVKVNNGFYSNNNKNTFIIKLASYSEDYYLYNETLKNYIKSRTNGNLTGSEKIYSNTSNGLGIFAGYTFRTDTVEY